MNHGLPKLSPGYKRPVSWLLLRLIDAYDVVLAPHLGGRCRFEPSCSNYMREAIVIHGIVKGIAMGLKRLVKCGPWTKGGYDPVPDPTTNH
ncbi:membrane protein insertion efficiency factor YidD [bacterium]|nr:membrane protein insertion efficiency factor YidD [bacterium]MBU1636307.1 membrane protein insertion efficiency factor YidD [bacterium]